MNRRIFALGIFTIAIITSGCAISPRSSLWKTPLGFTKAQVLNASIQSAAQSGFTTANIDRESGSMSFFKRIGGGIMNLNVLLSEEGKMIVVRTTAEFTGDLALKGLHEEVISNFHVYLQRILKITDPGARNVQIQS